MDLQSTKSTDTNERPWLKSYSPGVPADIKLPNLPASAPFCLLLLIGERRPGLDARLGDGSGPSGLRHPSAVVLPATESVMRRRISLRALAARQALGSPPGSSCASRFCAMLAAWSNGSWQRKRRLR